MLASIAGLDGIVLMRKWNIQLENVLLDGNAVFNFELSL